MTPSQTVGPFFHFAFGWAGAALVDPAAPGAFVLGGRVLDGEGVPIADAVVELWQADPLGVLRDDGWGFGRALTDATGRYAFTTVKPGRVAGQAPHANLSIFARGLLQRVITRVYFPDEVAANAADPVLAAIGDPRVRDTLVAVSDGRELCFDIHLQGPRETAFFLVE